MTHILKLILTISNLFILWGLAVLIFYLLKKKKITQRLVYSGVILLLFCSTNYIPKKLLYYFEKQQEVIDLKSLDKSKYYYIHVLGSGYKLDSQLPAIGQLEPNTLVRLTEGIRIFNSLSKKTIITSGKAYLDSESQAEVSRRAAIELGVSPQTIKILQTPSSTMEEALALKANIGIKNSIIIVTDASHMPRATKIFKSIGLDPIPAPTNFRVKFGPNSYNGFSLPSFKSMINMEIWLREFLATLYFELTELSE